MPILTTLLVAVSLCLRDTVAFNVFLEATNLDSRSQWGVNDILLTCVSDAQSQHLVPVSFDAVFFRDQKSITISGSVDADCTPSGDQYCYAHGGERLSFTANSVTEGKHACEYEGQTSNELAIVAYPDEVLKQTKQIGEWGMELVLLCRYAPGQLANDFYHHNWISIVNDAFVHVSSNDNIHDDDTDFSLTFVKLNPVVAEYNYMCGIDFADNVPSQPYNLRSSPHEVDNAIDVIISEIQGDVSIERGPSNAVVSANELATFSCALNVTGNEVIQFKMFGSTFNDRRSECRFGTTSLTRCSWPNYGINMTCDYSVAYQITCNLTVGGLTEASSTQVVCSSETVEDAPSTAAAPSATAALAVRIGNIPTPTIGKVDDSNDFTSITFDLPAVPFIPLEVQTVFFRGSDQVGSIDHLVISESKVVKISISNSDVPEGRISVRIRLKYLGDDNRPFSDFSDESNSLVIKEEELPHALSPTVGSGTGNKENGTMYYIQGGFGALLFVIFIGMVILSLYFYRKKNGPSAQPMLANGDGPAPPNTSVGIPSESRTSYA